MQNLGRLPLALIWIPIRASKSTALNLGTRHRLIETARSSCTGGVSYLRGASRQLAPPVNRSVLFKIAVDYGDRLIALGQFKDSLTAMAPGSRGRVPRLMDFSGGAMM